ncbi:RNA polymerase subunit sigma [Pandoraea captiosa]|uniref:RNA polymerase subunit sigma n=1 Tax=Pandoraea captiosa TaxID=2508302 RepID=A0A5E4ZWL1_9BURK|nr:sigma-70 family RNA polymerase sigma factor [Pandoraea captiosa]VVE64655.1 RNA polymerase subunit sigma [Pandoraea captiosa]
MDSSETELRQHVAGLYTEHYGWLTGWIRRKLGDAGVAADLAQDTFVNVLSAGTATQIQAPRPFLATVAKHILSHYHRRQALEASYLDWLAGLPEAFSPAPEERLVALQTLALIDRALDGLPPKAREAFLLAHLGEMKYADIARQLGVSLASVKLYMLRANRQCLQVMLD